MIALSSVPMLTAFHLTHAAAGVLRRPFFYCATHAISLSPIPCVDQFLRVVPVLKPEQRNRAAPIDGNEDGMLADQVLNNGTQR